MVRLNDQVFVTEVGDQAVVLDAGASTYLSANDTGSTILKALSDDRDVEELVVLVTREFEIDEDTARRDCVTFVAELDRRGWLTDGDPASGKG